MARHHRTRDLLMRYNTTASPETAARRGLLDSLLGRCEDGAWIEPPFYCDGGANIHLGAGVFVNFNCVFLDGESITIGAGTLIGPAVQIYATAHPVNARKRIFEREGVPAYHTTAAPITIGRNVWIGGGAIILPGVCIGDNSTIGAGSVVTRSVPGDVFAAGNPCRVVRPL
ncbi:sugar O-acetyltransferase [Shimia sp. SDUM112013]|uniref:sugar O-acetyltransferase n=1 Tax=Shimia sp. SDUM112013 TaxID=3136160 RepID=UPI0032F042F4